MNSTKDLFILCIIRFIIWLISLHSALFLFTCMRNSLLIKDIQTKAILFALLTGLGFKKSEKKEINGKIIM